MYKVIIADDHIPVLNYLQSSIPWEELAFELTAACSDGGEALEACLSHLPDILITDIGMPVMNGLEVIDKAREGNPRLKAVILSCHEDFQFAQQAVKLNVSDYILKESLRIEQITSVLRQLKARLDEESASRKDHRQLQDVVKQNRFAIRAAFLRTLLEQPVWNEREWEEKAAAFGIRIREGVRYLPVMAMPERASELEGRFGGTHNMQFVLDNALHELIRTEGSVFLTLDEKHSFILLPFSQTLKRNIYDDIRSDLQQAQQSLRRHMRLGVSFYTGNVCGSLFELKRHIQELLDVKTFRFYAGERCIAKLQPVETTKDDIFMHYSGALQDLRDCILSKTEANAAPTVEKWVNHIEAKRYPVEAVRSWVLNMATELELKYTIIQHFVTNFNAEQLQRTIHSIGTLEHLMEWLRHFLEQKIIALQAAQDGNVRKEVAEAKRYVLTHLSEKVGMEEMANRLNLNPTHFSRVFKNETGETFVEFVTRSKMERAREMLNQSDLTVQQIAEQLGFDHTSYFIKLFRNFSGKSPVEYRKTI